MYLIMMHLLYKQFSKCQLKLLLFYCFTNIKIKDNIAMTLTSCHTRLLLCNIYSTKLVVQKKTLWSHFMDEVQLPQGQSHFKDAVYFLPLSSQKLMVLTLDQPWSHTVVFNMGHLDWESSTLASRSLLHCLYSKKTFTGGILIIDRNPHQSD